MRLFALLFILALMFGCARPAAAAPSSDPGTRAVQDWLSYRYLYPRRWDLATMLQALHRRGLLQTKAGQAPLTAFLAGIVRQRADAVAVLERFARDHRVSAKPIIYALWMGGYAQWAKRLSRDFGVAPAALSAWDLPPPRLLQLPVTTPRHVDVLWAAYSATGDDRLARRVLDLAIDYYTHPKTVAAPLKQAVEQSLRRQWQAHEAIRRVLNQRLRETDGAPHAYLHALRNAAMADYRPPLAARHGPLSAHLGVRTDADWVLRWLHLPSEDVPLLPPVDSAHKPVEVAFELLVAGLALRDDLRADATVDFLLTTPEDAIGRWIGPRVLVDNVQPTQYRVVRLTPPLTIQLGRWDYEGVYRVLARIRDRVSGRELTTEAQFEYRPSLGVRVD